jgi:CheY-like chemotaxis protein
MTIKFETVPLAELEARKLQPDQSPTAPVVLVVDADPAEADSLVGLLKRAGYAAEAAYDGKTALEMALLVPPELLLTDVAMPGMDGVELAIAVRKAVPDCKVLLLSGKVANRNLATVARDAMQKEFAVLTKPIQPDDLLAQASRLFGQS